MGIVFRVAIVAACVYGFCHAREHWTAPSLDFFNCLFTTNLKDIGLLRQSIHYPQLANITRDVPNYVLSVAPPKKNIQS